MIQSTNRISLAVYLVALLVVSLLTLAAGGANAATSQDKKIVIRLTHDKPAGGSMAIIPERFKAFVDADASLKDKVVVQIYPAAQLYKADHAPEAVMRGDVHMCLVGGNVLSAIERSVAIFDLPFLFKDINAINAYGSSPQVQEIYKPLEEKGIKYLVCGATGAYGILTKKVAVKKPEDMKGLKVRALGDAARLFQAVGASPINMAAGDVYIGLQRGTIDGADFGPTSIVERKLYEVSDHYFNLFTHATIQPVLANTKFWNGLPADIRDKLTAHLKAAEKICHELVPKMDEDYLQQMQHKYGMKVYTPSEEEGKVWIKAVENVVKEAAQEVGPNIVKYVQSLRK